MLKSFLKLGVVVGALPFNIQDGQLIDAVPVMGNFNWIVSQINANIPPLIPTLAASMVYVPAGSVGGGANAITLAPATAITAYAAGQMFRFPAGAANTGAVTVATSGLAPRALLYPTGLPLTGQELLSGGIYDIVDNGANYDLINASQGTGILPFTPTISFGGASVGVVYGLQLGNYMKFGRMVFFTIDLLLVSKGVSAGPSLVSGLPFTCNASWPAGGFGGSLALQVKNLGFSTGVDCYATAGVVPNTKTINIYTNITAGAINRLADISFANNSELVISGFYPT